jgi:galactonate dehydratase
MFFEEPIMPENIEQLALLHEKSPVPIAAGERFYSKFDFNSAISKNSVDYIQPDIRIMGGITEIKKVAALAEANFIQVAPHNIHGQVGTAHTLQILASIPNARILEYSVEYIPQKAEIFNTVLKAENGYIKIPDEPGIGLELYEENLHKYPHKPMSMIEKMFRDEI